MMISSQEIKSRSLLSRKSKIKQEEPVHKETTIISVKDFFGKSLKSTDEDLEDDRLKQDIEEANRKIEEGKRKHREKLEREAQTKVFLD